MTSLGWRNSLSISMMNVIGSEMAKYRDLSTYMAAIDDDKTVTHSNESLPNVDYWNCTLKRLRLQNICSIIHAISRSLHRERITSAVETRSAVILLQPVEARGGSELFPACQNATQRNAAWDLFFICLLEKIIRNSRISKCFFLYKGFSLNFIKCRISQKKVRFTYKDESIAEADDWWKTKKWLLISKMAFVRNTNRTRWAESCDRDGEEDLDKHFGRTLRVKN